MGMALANKIKTNLCKVKKKKKKRTISTRIDPDVLESLDKRCKRDGLIRSAVIEALAREYVAS